MAITDGRRSNERVGYLLLMEQPGGGIDGGGDYIRNRYVRDWTKPVSGC